MCHRDRERERYRADPQKQIQAARQWARDNRERSNAYFRAYRAAHPRPSIRKLDEDTKDFYWVLRGDPCCYCGRPTQSIDHIEPRAVGGADHWTNFTGACFSCNSSKNDDTLLGFLIRRAA